MRPRAARRSPSRSAGGSPPRRRRASWPPLIPCRVWTRAEGSSGLLRLPERLVATVLERRPAAEHEQGVRQAVQVGHGVVADVLAALAEGDDDALGAPAHGAAEMEVRRGPAAAGQDEALQDRQVVVE